MKSVISIFLLTLLVSIQTPVGQLFRLPLLIEHFIKHKEQDGVSLRAFLQEHYSPGHNDSDRSEDDQLPFKNVTINSTGYAVIPGVIANDPYVIIPISKITLPQHHTLQQYSKRIFHPPKV